MDINYLLWLQELRIETENVLTPFMKWLSSFSVSYLLLLPVLIYWCWDKRRGLLTLVSLYLCTALTALIKLTACVYRPWIKDPRIIPAVKSLPTSYSFPSRHTIIGATICFGSAAVFWQKRLTKILAVLFIILAVLTGLSRNYLGVHTPQDVIVGFIFSIFCLCIVWKVGNYLQKHPERENMFLILTALFSIAALIYVVYKPYPLDYIDGKLLVSPTKAAGGAFEAFGALFAFSIARYIEKTWVRFQVTGLNLKGISLGIAGLIPLYILFTYTEKPLRHLLPYHLGKFAWAAILVFYIITLYPLILKYLYSNKSNK